MSRQDKETYSVLVMGKTQAGKSALIQHIKKYANPDYSIDRSLLGNGNLSKTESTRPFFVESNLPAYEAYRKDTGEVIDLTDLSTRCEDEEDYREILFSREKDVGLRIKPQDDKTVSEIVEFRFLDTPGLHDTNDRDSSHAVNIISEMINTRSFNLIVVIVSYKNPLTQEQHLALEYYADVFKGLHTRIMFLHTHVDYADVHHTNVTDHLNLRMKNKALSKLFRRYDSETVFDEDDFQEYPSLTIDFTSRIRRPVIQCLIRNTIRELLKMATQSPVVFDTSSQNIDRIRGITHPTQFNDEQRKKVKQRFAAEAAKHERPAEVEEADVGGEDSEQINILLIGDVQSGKTSLVETFRLYADPAYTAKTEHITQGNSRFADEKVKITPFLADLHTVQIRKLKRTTGKYDVIDLEEEAKKLSEEDFNHMLNLDPKEVDTVIINSNSAKKYRFNIYEGPSLNESAKNFEKNIFSVHRTLVESDQKFHQVLFTLAPGPITSAIKTTIRICSDILSDLSSLFSFVHTKIDCPKLHFGNKQFQDSMKERQELLQRYIQSSAAPYLIDCNLQSNWPVQRAKTYNVVHDILRTAIAQTPIALKSPLMKKTPKIVSIDSELKWLGCDAFLDTQKEITQNNKDLLELYGKIRQLDIDYKAKDQVVNSAKNKENVTTRNDMEVVFEETYTATAEPYPEIHSRTMTFKKQYRTIEKVHMIFDNVEIEMGLGGEGFNHWKIIYRRTSGAAASLVVKLYSKKQDSAGNPIGETSELAAIRLQRLDLEKQLAAVEERIRSKWHVQKEYNLLRDWISRETLPKAVMEELTKAEVYEAKEIPFDKIKEIYLKSGGVHDSDPCEPVERVVPQGVVESTTPAGIEEVEDEEHKVEDDHETAETCSVLVFGKTQAGKSTFIEFVKKYANQKYTINETLLGTGFMSKTRVPLQFSIKSNLPAYEVFDRSGTRIDIGSLGDKHRDPEDYFDALNDKNTTLKPVPHDPNTSPPTDFEITFLDTPGIEDTFGMDAEHAPKIIDAMAKMQAFNLIIVIINCQEQPSIAHQLAFNYYSKVIHAFQGHHSNIIFLYTHVDYDKCHHSDANHLATMKLQHEAFSQLFQFSEQSTIPGSFSRERVSKAKTTANTYHSFNIDFGRRRRPVAQCMRLMTLREILDRAVNSPPVVLDTSPGNLERIDSIIHPDKLNHEERNKTLDSRRAILRQQQESSEAPEAASDGLNAQNDPNSGSGVECTFVDLSFSAHDDCEEYFRGVPQVDDLESEDEDGDRLASPGSGIGMEALLSRCLDTLSHEK